MSPPTFRPSREQMEQARMRRETEVRWCPECDEPHIGGCPWAELEKRADPTVSMPTPETGPIEQAGVMIESMAVNARRLVACTIFTLLLTLVSLFAFGIQHQMTATEAEMQKVEAQSRQIHERIMEIQAEIDMQERKTLEAMERAEYAGRRGAQ